jgi:hypothetical protein
MKARKLQIKKKVIFTLKNSSFINKPQGKAITSSVTLTDFF